MTRDPHRKPKHIAPCVMLISLNVAAGLTASTWLLHADLVPFPLAAHAAMMIVAWGCVLPLGGVVARYFKVTPGQRFPAVVDNPFWWNCHRVLQYCGTTLATASVVTVLWEIGGQIGTLHGRCGLVVMSVAWLQVASPLFRGSKGGPTDEKALASNVSTWRGDHFDMTLRRRIFEAWHKPVGWCLIALAQVTILLGADLVGAPAWLLGLIALMMSSLGLVILDSHLRGRWVDTHIALWGPDAAP